MKRYKLGAAFWTGAQMLQRGDTLVLDDDVAPPRRSELIKDEPEPEPEAESKPAKKPNVVKD